VIAREQRSDERAVGHLESAGPVGGDRAENGQPECTGDLLGIGGNGYKLEESSGSKWRRPPKQAIAEVPSGLSSDLSRTFMSTTEALDQALPRMPKPRMHVAITTRSSRPSARRSPNVAKRRRSRRLRGEPRSGSGPEPEQIEHILSDRA
jgi:hypothetical protein